MSVSATGNPGRAASLAATTAFVSAKPSNKSPHQVAAPPAQPTAFVSTKGSSSPAPSAAAAHAAAAGGTPPPGQQLDVKL